MLVWEYMKLDLGQAPNKMGETDVLNRVGRDGWELVWLTSNNLAYLKRPMAPPARPAAAASRKTEERSSTG